MIRLKGLFLAILFICLLLSNTQAQNKYVDSLKRELNTGHHSDSQRIDILIELGNNLAFSESGTAINYFLKAYRYAIKSTNALKMGEALSGIGNTYYYKGSYDSAMHYFVQADGMYKKSTAKEANLSIATNKASIGNLEVSKNDYPKAIRYFLQAINLIAQSADFDNKWKILGNLYASVANVYHDMNQHDKALMYDIKGLEAHKREKANQLLTAYMEIYVASDYINLKMMDKAAVHLSNADKLAVYIQSADLFDELYRNRGDYHKHKGNLQAALSSYQKALIYAQKSGRKFQKMNDLRMMAFVYRDMKAYPQSIRCMEKALPLTRELGTRKLEAELLKNLANINSALHQDHDAVKNYKLYIKLSDSLNGQETKRKINEIENKYQAVKRQARITELQKNNQVQSLQLHQKNLLNITLVAGSILLLLTAFLLYVNLKNKNRLFMQKEELHKQRILELEKEQQLLTVQSLLKGQEEERGRLARDLHDGVGGLLSGVKLSLSTMKGNVFLSEENAQSFNNVVFQLDQSIAELRRVSHNMMPEALIKFGLKEALENYCENLTLSGKLKVQLQTYGLEQRLEQSTEIILYRIVQELLNNVIRHAEAKTVLIQLIRENNRFSLTAEDDGKGFDPAQVNTNSAGLANIRARAEYLDGTLDIRSVPGEGTSVHIEGKCS